MQPKELLQPTALFQPVSHAPQGMLEELVKKEEDLMVSPDGKWESKVEENVSVSVGGPED